MATSSGVWGGAHPLTAAAPADSSAGTGNSATISANDFLTLLVTEMQNQDPTADTDPNEYINQLVNVNSLEQLIDINQTLSSATGGAGGSTTASGAEQPGTPSRQTEGPIHLPVSSAAVPNALKASFSQEAAGPRATAGAVLGNLGIPPAAAAALRIAQALGGH